MLHWIVRCAVRGLLVCDVLGGARQDAYEPLCCVELVATCVASRARACGVMVAGSAVLCRMVVIVCD
jgi:hypothetical protein